MYVHIDVSLCRYTMISDCVRKIHLPMGSIVLGKSFRIKEHLETQSGEERSSSGHFNPVGRLQQLSCLGSDSIKVHICTYVHYL